MPKKSAQSGMPLTRESRTAYETVHLPSLDVLVLEQLKEIITFSRVARQGYAICICNIPRLREDLIFVLTENLKPDGIGVYQVRLTANEWSLGRKIRILQRNERFLQFKNHYQKVVVSVTGLDETIQDSELKDYKRRPDPLQGINQQRDYFRTLPFPLLIWVPEWLAARLPEFTPDFWVGRSMVFEFLSASEVVSQSVSQLSGIEIAYENLDEAKRKIRVYKKLIKTSGNNLSIKASSLLNLGILHYRQGNYPEAEKLCKQSLKIFEELNNRSGIARSLHQLGNIHYTRGNYPEAERLYKQSLKIAEELNDKSSIAGSLHQLGNIHYTRGNYPEAERLYKQSLKIFEELSDKSGIAISLHQLGNIHYVQGNYPEAEKLYKQSLKIAEGLNDKLGIAASLHQLGIIQQRQGNYSEAEKLYRQSLKIKEDLGDKWGIIRTLCQLGNVHYTQGNYPEAEKLCSQSLNIAEELNDKSGIARNFCQLGRLAEKQGDNQEALQNYLIAFTIFKELKSPDAKVVEGNITRMAKRLGKANFQKLYKRALTNLKLEVLKELKKYTPSLKVYEEVVEHV